MKEMSIKVLDDQELEYVEILKHEGGFSRGESMILVALMINGNISMKELSIITGYPQPTVSMALNKLQKSNYVNLYTDTVNKHYFKRVELLIDPVEKLCKDHDKNLNVVFDNLQKARAYQSTPGA